jgi:hypothetical protein
MPQLKQSFLASCCTGGPTIKIISRKIAADGPSVNATTHPAATFQLIALIPQGLEQSQEIRTRLAKGPEVVGRNFQQQVRLQAAKGFGTSFEDPGFGTLHVHFD